ncbi:unnamed protein product [Staurois parvus]|uniref:Uncharacterized protein n=1 Tax=Staurois parvus TaxID=386267 RepID=A0ABN9C440_9NEOB|nr:unnamed protein product [Staurois parvus]
MVGVTGQVQQVGKQRSTEGQAERWSGIRQEQRAGTGYRAKRNTTPRQSLQVWPSLKYPSIISSRC